MGQFSLADISKDTTRLMNELLTRAKLKPGSILVAGVSTSEVVGENIGTAGNLEVAEAIFTAMQAVCRRASVFLAIQCCEHINRTVLVEEACVEKYGGERVNVVPWERAGGAFATFAYQNYKAPVMLKEIKADAGIDIGLTLIGMQLKAVAVPIRPENPYIGAARVVLAYTRLPLVGGARAKYLEI